MEYSSYYEPIAAPDYEADGHEYYQPTPATLSVWAPEIQHGGPPAGLLMRAMLRCAPDPDQHFTRVTTEILGPIGLGVNRIRARVLRPGRQITLIGADLEVQQPDGGFRTAAQSVGWRMRLADSAPIERIPLPALATGPDDVDSVIGVTADESLGVDWGTTGFIGTVESARVEGRTGDTPAVWLRPAIDLVADEPIADLESIFTVLDVANGLGTRLRPDEWTWMNTDTTVHLTAAPRGHWLGIDADMATGRHGFGATFADLYDVDGFIGRSAQTVLLNRNA
ncbi:MULTISPECIES: thioesterase family protein [unclassified Gordonia (in: high G+C Gram-positive bacteria)]|uniref:thioesterase family protein n=1 Tax=unclassified Gordonia (in: high G+C Gram-positive bacteria) TaxID=2657482 RepID=UPI001F0F1FDD|nr:thioesterase family protein [Gordonia sp. ABSL49_1]MCH5642803.1 thioesterase family protein [Gordonia sp. ABSL49_1]